VNSLECAVLTRWMNVWKMNAISAILHNSPSITLLKSLTMLPCFDHRYNLLYICCCSESVAGGQIVHHDQWTRPGNNIFLPYRCDCISPIMLKLPCLLCRYCWIPLTVFATSLLIRKQNCDSECTGKQMIVVLVSCHCKQL